MIACLSPNGRTMYEEADAPTELLVGTTGGIAKLERRGKGSEWKVAGRTLEKSHISSIYLETKQRGLFAGVHGGRLYRSMDGGKTWEPKAQGISVEHVFTVNSTLRDGKVVLYAGTEPAHLFVSEDYGENWRELPALRNVPMTEKWNFPAPPHQAHAKNINFDPRNPRVIFVGVEQGALLKSTDAGQSFTEITSYSSPQDEAYRDIHRCVLHPANPEEMYITGGEGLYHSLDGGKSWEHPVRRKSRIGYPDGLVILPRDDYVMFMSGAEHNPGTWRTSHFANAAIGRSRDRGNTWEILEGTPRNMRDNYEALTMSVWPRGYSVFVGTTGGEVYATEDEGQTWDRIAAGLPSISKGGHFRNLAMAS